MEASSSCTISLISDVTLPTRLGLRPIALRLPLFTSAISHLFCPSSYPTFSEHGHGNLVLFRIVGQSF